MYRLCIFAHFDRHNMVDKYVLNYLRGLRRVADRIVFVSTSKINGQDVEAVRQLADSVITRENIGYDFMSWQVGLNSVPDLSTFDEVILCNDSVYGPLYKLESVFKKMAGRACDFWGITEYSYKAFHLQSYFLVFRKQVVASKPFKEFWQSVTPEDSKIRIIEKYEIGLTDGLIKEGFKPATYARYTPSFVSHLWSLRKPWSWQKFFWLFIVAPLSGVVPRWKVMAPPDRKLINSTYVYWKKLVIQRKMPFLKVELLRSNPTGTIVDDYEEVLKKYSDYDAALIKNHLSRVNGMVSVESAKEHTILPNAFKSKQDRPQRRSGSLS